MTFTLLILLIFKSSGYFIVEYLAVSDRNLAIVNTDILLKIESYGGGSAYMWVNMICPLLQGQ